MTTHQAIKRMLAGTACALAIVASEVSNPITNSTSFILWTGLKKCMPITRSGQGTAVAISVTLSADA